MQLIGLILKQICQANEITPNNVSDIWVICYQPFQQKKYIYILSLQMRLQTNNGQTNFLIAVILSNPVNVPIAKYSNKTCEL